MLTELAGEPLLIGSVSSADEELELDALADRIISVELKRNAVRPTATKPDVPKDLEYPY